MCRSVESNRLRAMALVFFLVLALGSAVDASDKYTYPKCAAEASTCCALGKEKMASPGYMVVGGQPNGDVIVTCHHGELSCFRGNPSLRASTEGRDAVECPDFAALMESRAGLEVVDGVVRHDLPADSGAGVVKPHSDE
ncbi:hypothetical protein P43SY_000786 [Pythium insidiosum]|uniref:Uncharacterized protein n=1 Tax=Pythium insidiosum TaxID=114742 RepID=A0AAD5L9D7_PYTIN|nr:hypothetical protein P43SY_000786 [Pythium insidiosum]